MASHKTYHVSLPLPYGTIPFGGLERFEGVKVWRIEGLWASDTTWTSRPWLWAQWPSPRDNRAAGFLRFEVSRNCVVHVLSSAKIY